MTSMTAYAAAQRALRAWAFASSPSLLSGCSMACSHGPSIAAAQSDVARPQRVIPLKREGSLVAPAIETPYSVAQPEGPEPGPQDTPSADGACLLQCLYLADRCDRNCAGCAVTTGRADSEGQRGEARAQAAARQEGPDGNHGDRKISEGGTGL